MSDLPYRSPISISHIDLPYRSPDHILSLWAGGSARPLLCSACAVIVTETSHRIHSTYPTNSAYVEPTSGRV